jgi:flagellar secretion chaperone FliS
MRWKEQERSYRRMEIEGASPIGLILMLFDLLINDLRRAAVALRADDIETRCKELNHGFLVLGQLKSWVDLERGGEPARVLMLFYSQLGARMMDAGAQKSATILEQEIETILMVRNSWQKFEQKAGESLRSDSAATPKEVVERVPLSLSL